MPLAIYALALTSFAVGTQSYVFTGLLSDLAADLGVSVARAGQLVTAYAVTSALAAPLVVNVIIGFERRRVLVISLGVIGTINIALATLPTFALLVYGRVGLAACSALVIPLAGAIAADLVAPDKQGRALGLILSGLTLAFILGVPIGSLIGGQIGWRSTFIFAGVLTLLSLPFVARLVPTSRGPRRASLANFKILATPVVQVGLASSALAFVAAYPVFAFIGPFVEHVTGLGTAGIGAMQSVLGLGSIAGIVIGCAMADYGVFRRNTTRLLTALVLIQPLYSLWFLSPYIGTAWIMPPLAFGLFSSSAIVFALGPVIEKALVNAEPRHSPLSLALNTSMIYAGQGLGAAIGGVIISSHGYLPLGVFGAFVASIALFMACLASNSSRKNWQK